MPGFENLFTGEIRPAAGGDGRFPPSGRALDSDSDLTGFLRQRVIADFVTCGQIQVGFLNAGDDLLRFRGVRIAGAGLVAEALEGRVRNRRNDLDQAAGGSDGGHQAGPGDAADLLGGKDDYVASAARQGGFGPQSAPQTLPHIAALGALGHAVEGIGQGSLVGGEGNFLVGLSRWGGFDAFIGRLPWQIGPQV